LGNVLLMPMGSMVRMAMIWTVQMPLASSRAIRVSSISTDRMIQLGSGAGRMP
jgi:hypothetical protein